MTDILVRLFIKNYKDCKNPKVRSNYGYLSGVVGIIMNLILFTGKLFAGIISASVAITADAFNNLSDAGSSIITLVGFKMSEKPADSEHPFGHGRIEYISGFIISVIILIMGIEIGKSSITKIIHPDKVVFSMLSIIILTVSLLVKLWLSLFNRKLGKAVDSDTMKATALDSLSDMISTSTVIIGILISKFTGLSIDGYLGILVALFILYSGFSLAKETLNKLLGEAPDKEFIANVTKDVIAHPEIIGVHDFIVHNYGVGSCVISLHAEVSCKSDIMQIHDVIDNVESEIDHKYHCATVIHMDPIATDDEYTTNIRNQVKDMITSIDKSLTIHDFRLVPGTTHTNVLFDVVVPFGFRISDYDIKLIISQRLHIIDPLFIPKINIDKQS